MNKLLDFLDSLDFYGRLWLGAFAVFLIVEVLMAFFAIGDTPSCEPYGLDLPFLVFAFITTPFVIGYLTGRSRRP